MCPTLTDLDPRTRPPEPMRLLMKHWQKSSLQEIETGHGILDLACTESYLAHNVSPAETLCTETLDRAFNHFVGTQNISFRLPSNEMRPCFEIKSLPGLFVYPSLLPALVQVQLLNKMLHRDLSNPNHTNNLGIHYEIPYSNLREDDTGCNHQLSFFDMMPDTNLKPKDPMVHRPLTTSQMLDRKLRWITLGGQYDWTAKTYPSEQPPPFPSDIGRLLSDIWPNVDAQAAIVNFYTPGDTLSVHRDVSEECDRGLISISIGCDALFIAGNQDGTRHITLRLRSGDAVLMSGESRFAWHAVPKVLPDTCPHELQDWPCLGYSSQYSAYSAYKGWLKNKRINLNVRQMRLGSRQ